MTASLSLKLSGLQKAEETHERWARSNSLLFFHKALRYRTSRGLMPFCSFLNSQIEARPALHIHIVN